jgi:hypothetical protein
MTQTVVKMFFFLVSLRQALHYQDVILVITCSHCLGGSGSASVYNQCLLVVETSGLLFLSQLQY